MRNWNGTRPYLWRRFIDDIFFLWNSSAEELDLFIEHLNSQHAYIKFEATYDQELKKIPFLDMEVSVENNKIITDLYKKETARVQYLLPSSNHAAHVSRNIPFSLGYRLLRICTYPERFKHHLEGLRQDLISRDYLPKVIDDAFKKVCAIPREQALERVEKSKTERRPVLAITYHPSLPSMTNIVRKHWEVMTNQSHQLKRCFPQAPLVAYKRSKNIGEHLIRAKLPNRKSSRKKNGFVHCTRRCFACIQCERASEHKCHRSGRTWQITAPLNCESQNCVYKIGCRKCRDFVYIGETRRRFCDRLTDHRGYVTRKVLDHPIGFHFNKEGHDITDMIPLPIEKVFPEGDDLLRKRREKVWIHAYDAVSYGANSRE